MRKSLFILILLAVLVVSFSKFYVKIHGRPELPETTLHRSFNYSGAKVVSSEIYFWGKLNDGFNTFEMLKLLATDIAKDLGIVDSDGTQNKYVSNGMVEEVEIYGTSADNKIINLRIQSSKEPDGKSEKYISVSIVQDLSNNGLEKIRAGAMEILEKYKINPKVNSCITGNFDGKLDNNQLNEICKNIFRGAGAKKVEGIRDKNLVSVSAYSPVIQDSIQVNGKNVNLNLAIRYNSFEDKTYIWLATPVIATEY